MDIGQLGPLVFVILCLTIIGIIGAAIRWRLNPFISLVLASLFFGFSLNFIGGIMGAEKAVVPNVIATFSKGFGGLLSSIGLVIIFGTLLGKSMEVNGSMNQLAEKILGVVGKKRSLESLSAVGWIVSIPVFCDSGFVILNSFKKSLAKITGYSVAALSIALATGLYASHTFVPPTPGPLIAAANLNISAGDLIWIIIFGGLISFVAALVGLFCAKYVLRSESSRSFIETSKEKKSLENEFQETLNELNSKSSFFTLSLPMLLPIILISLNSLSNFPVGNYNGEPLYIFSGIAKDFLAVVGHPFVAVMIGFFIAFFPLKRDRDEKNSILHSALRDSASILLITGAGGGFGALIKASPIADYLRVLVYNADLSPLIGLWIMFLLAAALKTAQGSSTAAIVITSSIAVSLLDPFGLTPVEGAFFPGGPVLAVLAIGAGAMVVSHVNDSYFWVVTQFSDMNPDQAVRQFSLSTFLQGFVAMIAVTALAILFLLFGFA